MSALFNDAVSTARLSANLAIVPQTNTIKMLRNVRLIDISYIAREAGLRVPTALTPSVWMHTIEAMCRPIALADVQEAEENIWQTVRDVQDALRKSRGLASSFRVILTTIDNQPLEVIVRLEVGANGETVLVIRHPIDL
ncbi:hypothetical protein ACQUFY_26510 (plasmid) [Robbsia andropogonis]|uniref:hypothetical protein n=1 Tax=Robbsia andropogonis TaxID=28092 RepID=UPI003D224A44